MHRFFIKQCLKNIKITSVFGTTVPKYSQFFVISTLAKLTSIVSNKKQSAKSNLNFHHCGASS